MIEKITLENGVRILAERIEHVRSASIGIWVASGSRHEPPGLSGISHFIEHIVFKGTATRSAAEIAHLMDGIGGQVNAFTTKECTCFYAKALDRHLHLALDVLCDMFFMPAITPRDVKTERGVILEEIDMERDTPEELCSERLFSAIYKGTALEPPVLGRPVTLRRMSASSLRRYMRAHFVPARTVVSISGSFTKEDLAYLTGRFSTMEPTPDFDGGSAAYTPTFTVKNKDIEQNHLCLGFPAPGLRDPERHAMQLLNCVLGGGASSRLFQLLREQRGLCYSVYSFTAMHEDAGLLGIYAALGREDEREALGLIRQEFMRMAEEGPDERELTRAREQITASILMGLESTGSRMTHMARSELIYGRVPSAEEIIADYEAVTLADMRALARRVLRPEALSFSAVGRVRVPSWYKNILLG